MQFLNPRPWLPRGHSQTLSARRDLLAAVLVSALMIPQALGYAALAGVPVQAGLYAIPPALLVYAFFGSSPQLVVGPVSTVSALTGSIVVANGATGSDALGLVAALAVISGLLLVLAGTLRIGWVAEFLSKPIVTGFVFGLSIGIIIGEIPVLLGLGRVSGTGLGRVIGIIDAAGEFHTPTALIGIGALIFLFAGSRAQRSGPWGLLLVVGALVASRNLDLTSRDVELIGSVPGGIPRPSLPAVDLSNYGELVISGAALAMVGLAESLSAARLFAVRNGYRTVADQELVATGAANIASGLMGGLGVAGSLSKTATADRAGARTQLTSLAAAVIAIVALLLFASSLEALPKAVLSAIVIQAVWGLMDAKAIARYRKIRRNDFVSAVAALVGVLVLGVLYGLLAAIAQSVLGLVYRSGKLEVDILGKVKSEKAAWGSLSRKPNRKTVDGILVIRLSAPLFWVNSARATALVMDAIEAAPDTAAIVLDLEATDQLDITSADELASLIQRLRKRNIDIYVVRLMYPARKVLEATGVIELLGRDHMWRTISQGVRAAKADLKSEI